MNQRAQELNADEREALAKLIAMDVNDMRETHIEAVKARRDYLTEPEKERFPFLSESSEPQKMSKVKKPTPLNQE